MSGGYDEGYKSCPCFWGKKPGSLILELQKILPDLAGLSVLDIGCGEGKNAAFFGTNGSTVKAIDVSEIAISKARQVWGEVEHITWEVNDVRQTTIHSLCYDVVIAYGLLHCLTDEREIKEIVTKLKRATKIGGYNIVCTFNSRYQELDAHPGFHPCLMRHSFFVDLYDDWEILHESDSDLHEQHPHNNIAHTHSMTRLISRRKK